MKVEQIMRHHVVSCREGDALSHVAQLMWEHGREHRARKRDVTYAEIGETLDAVCRPRGPRAICVVAA